MGRGHILRPLLHVLPSACGKGPVLGRIAAGVLHVRTGAFRSRSGLFVSLFLVAVTFFVQLFWLPFAHMAKTPTSRVASRLPTVRIARVVAWIPPRVTSAEGPSPTVRPVRRGKVKSRRERGTRCRP